MTTIPKCPSWFKWAGAALAAVALFWLPLPAEAVVTTCGQGFPCNPLTMACSTAWSCCHIIGGNGSCVHQPQCDGNPSECWEEIFKEPVPPFEHNWNCSPAPGSSTCTMPTVPLLAAMKLSGGWSAWTTHINETRALLLRYVGDLKILQPNDAWYKGRLKAYLHIAAGLNVIIRAVADPPNANYQFVPPIDVTPPSPPLLTDATLTPAQAAALDAWAMPMRQMADALGQYNETIDNLGGAILDYQAGHQTTAKPWVCRLARATDAAMARASVAGVREVAARAALSAGPVKAMAPYCPVVADQVKVMQDAARDGATSYDAALLGQKALGACVPAATWPTAYIAASSADAAWYASWTSLGHTAAVASALGITCPPPTDTIGVWRPSTNTFYLRNSNTAGPANLTIAGIGAPGDVPLMGDWDGNGSTTIGLFRPNTKTFYLWNSNTYGNPDIQIAGIGATGDVPLVGDWDGNGTTTFGLWRPSSNTFYLWNKNGYGAPDLIIASVGAAGDTPIVGDWFGQGKTTIGLYRPSTNTYYLWPANAYGTPAVSVAGLGAPGDLPVVGDWDGNGTATLGLYRPSTHTFYLWNQNAYGPPNIIVPNYGVAGDVPVAGNWDGQ